MNNIFLDRIQTFLYNSDIENRLPEIIPTTISEEGKRSTLHCVEVHFSGNRSRAQEPISGIILFTALDVLIDIWHPKLEGESFRQRYIKLPSVTLRDRVVKEVYRIMKFIRNVMVHNRSGVQYHTQNVHIHHKDKNGKTEFAAEYTPLALVYLNTIILLLLKNRNATDKYTDCVLSAYYMYLKSEIIKFQDDIKEPLEDIKCGVDFKPLRRFRIDCTDNTINKPIQGYSIQRMSITPSEAGCASDEFLITKDGDTFIIPGEVLGELNFISNEILPDWKIYNPNSIGDRPRFPDSNSVAPKSSKLSPDAMQCNLG